MADHDDRSIVPVDLKAHLQEVLHQFFGDLVGHEHRAVVIFPGMVAGEHDLPVVVSNFELDDVDAIVSAIGLIGPPNQVRVVGCIARSRASQTVQSMQISR